MSCYKYIEYHLHMLLQYARAREVWDGLFFLFFWRIGHGDTLNSAVIDIKDVNIFWSKIKHVR